MRFCACVYIFIQSRIELPLGEIVFISIYNYLFLLDNHSYVESVQELHM